MEEKVDIVALGELLIDFTEARHSQDGRKLSAVIVSIWASAY